MPKNKRPVPRKSHTPALDEAELLSRQLATLALALAESEHGDDTDEDGEDEPGQASVAEQRAAFDKLLRNALRNKNDEVLYGAIEMARDEDVGAYAFLREAIGEASATLVVRKEGRPAMEVTAFAIPLFVGSEGGLREEQTFQDGEAFELLRESFVAGALESPQASVVLLSHAYDPGEAERITYSMLHEMTRDAAASMTEKKLVARPALEQSMSGWSGTRFGPADRALELRFLIGFAMKRADDPFYQVPSGEAEADRYFEERLARYRTWTATAAPLVRRCLGPAPDRLEINFLYQDLFFGAREQGMAELDMLAMLAELSAAQAGHGGAVNAVVGPADAGGSMQLQVCLRSSEGEVLARAGRPLDLAADLETEVLDICDALATLGIDHVSVALRFGPDGVPWDEQPFRLP
ncbi:hypothetical protein KY495_19785 [Massilia sp. PAMC28688]|uniref:hypothetical protein n=1 Tax=Massilia sp. PAMC28688 TaxID=2861283 RepID=UPI001C6277B4|nr:hypothetical protein [Massilia sp. PAMC28688]QYF92929.1 hypothetical protein KY495_19785 [Massilia sp. PAMC28688]